MPDSSRVWIYQSNRKLSQQELTLISDTLKNFCSQWAAHGTDLQTSFDVQYNRFVILSVNEQNASASGCSIDGSVHIIRSLEQQLNIDFFNRTEVAFWNGGEISTYPLQDLKKLFHEGRLTETSLSFNTLVKTLGEWRTHGLVQLANSWLKRYIPKIPVG
jgi:enoyl-[acyl-carrier-protein] reductase (NADH)